ncbi:MAG: prenyltransferase [Patescibacteria group bacterium]|nr:MAG: prenyltransferase [Patescibacteria group bacterium]
MKERLSLILKISRPRFWFYVLGPYILGWAVGGPDIFINPSFYLGLVFFSFPANFFIYGINDYYDKDTDLHNTKKGTKEIFLKERKILKPYLLITIFIFFLYFLYARNIYQKLLLLIFYLLSYFYSSPPLRFKAKPFIDSLSNILYALPGFYAYHNIKNEGVPIWVFIAAWLWTSSMHLFSAIPDIEADKKAGLKTTAVFLSFKYSLYLCLILWLLSALIATLNTGFSSLILFVYPFITFLIIVKFLPDLNKTYWKFPFINTVVGFILFLNLIF